MKNLSLILLIIIPLISFSQNEWDSWNKNYKEKNIPELITNEKIYADSVEKGLIKGEYYLRMDHYRFSAFYTGEKRKITANTLKSMKRVYMTVGNPDYLSKLDEVENELRFQIEGIDYWFAVQPILERPMEEEFNDNEIIYLYCLFLNEHTENRELFNSFLVSEFHE